MKTSFYILLTAAASLHAAVDWKPHFDDAPVPAEQSAAIDAALPNDAIVEPGAQRRVLVYSATSGFRHKSIPTGKEALAKLGLSTGAYEAVVSDDPDNFEPEVLKTFDTVILLSPTQDFFMPLDRPKISHRDQFTEAEWDWLKARNDRLVDNLVQYVEQGGGLMGIHAATDSCYGHKAYGELIGAHFDGHPWSKDNKVHIVVEDPEHATIQPVFEGIDSFEIFEEIYQFKPEPYSRERLRVLLHVDTELSDQVEGLKREDNDYPVAWVQSVGKGRVFYTSIGHNEHIYSNPLMLNHYLAGIQFTCGDLQADTTPSAQLSLPHVTTSTADWVPLFDGETLDGWEQRDGTATYEVRDGVIVGRSIAGVPNSFLCTTETFGDFELKFEVNCGEINSGVMIRANGNKSDGSARVNGPQVEIERGPGQAGFIYGEAMGGGWRSPEPRSKDAAVSTHATYKNGEWNEFRVLAEGPRIRTWINGQLIADLTDDEGYARYTDGFLGLQVHKHKIDAVEIEWRNIRIRELSN